MGVDELEAWLAEGYERSFRTACLILRDRAAAEDAVQEAYLRAWRFRDALPGGDGRRAWLYRVLVNVCVSRLRAEALRARRSADGASLEALVSAGAGPEAAAVGAGLASAVGEALAALPPHLRVPVVLRYWAGLTEREIAVAIRRRPGTVKSRLFEARRRLAGDPRLVALLGEEVAP